MKAINFYDKKGIIEHYDKFIDWKKRMDEESHFYINILKEAHTKNVLDCAAGTGFHTIMLAKNFFCVEGSDNNPEMLKKAKKNSKKQNLSIEFYKADWRNLSSCIYKEYDAIICAGNSLPLLSSEKEIQKSLKEMYSVLTKGGIVVLDFKNFEKLNKNGKTIEQGAVLRNQNSFECFFHIWNTSYNKMLLYVIYIWNDSKVFESKLFRSSYYPIRADECKDILKQVGFKEVNFYGDYKLSAFNNSVSDHVQIIAKK